MGRAPTFWALPCCRLKIHDDPMSKTKGVNRRQIALPESSKQKGLEPRRIPLRCSLARSLLDSLLVRSAKPSEEQLRRLSIIKKKTVPAQLEPRRRRTVLDPFVVMACRGEGRSCTRRVEPINQPSASDVPGAATPAEAATVPSEVYARTRHVSLSPRTSRRNLSRRAPNHHQNPPAAVQRNTEPSPVVLPGGSGRAAPPPSRGPPVGGGTVQLRQRRHTKEGGKTPASRERRLLPGLNRNQTRRRECTAETPGEGITVVSPASGSRCARRFGHTATTIIKITTTDVQRR